MEQKNILLLFTGGTISMIQDKDTNALIPADLDQFRQYMPELFNGNIKVDIIPFTPLLDSSNINPDAWSRMATMIYENYNKYNGFVITHGTDTMAYSASALSFMLENLQKPIIFTGSQLPIGVLRSDAKENLLTAIEIAAATNKNGNALVPEVCIFFESKLYRGNRTTKKASEDFAAFKSYNYNPLAIAGVHIKYFTQHINYPDYRKSLKLRTKTNQNVIILKLFPGITELTVKSIFNIPNLKGVILETYGSGNAPSDHWLYDAIKDATDKGIIIVNKTQCLTGSVEMGRYETSLNLINAGVLSGYDITTEALLTKMMYLFGENQDNIEKIKELLSKNLCGEMTVI